MNRNTVAWFVLAVALGIAGLTLSLVATESGSTAITEPDTDSGGRRSARDHSVAADFAPPQTLESPRPLPRNRSELPPASSDNTTVTAPAATTETVPMPSEDYVLLARTAEPRTIWGRAAEARVWETLPTLLRRHGAEVTNAECRASTCVIDIRGAPEPQFRGALREVRRYVAAASVDSCYHGTLDPEEVDCDTCFRAFLHCLPGRAPRWDMVEEVFGTNGARE